MLSYLKTAVDLNTPISGKRFATIGLLLFCLKFLAEIRAGKILLSSIRGAIQQGVSFSSESTMSGKVWERYFLIRKIFY